MLRQLMTRVCACALGALLAIGCVGDHGVECEPDTPSQLRLEPLPDERAEILALVLSGEIEAPLDLYERIHTDLERIDAAKASLRLAEEKLKAEEKKFEVGLSTTHDLLEFQDELARAESREALSRADYEKSLANLARVKGVLLEEHNITID